MPISYTLDADAVQRTASAVKFVEAMPRDNRGPQRRRHRGSRSAVAIAVGTLSGSLSPGGSAGFTFTIGGSGTGTCYDPGLLCSGDSVASGATVVLAQIAQSGTTKWYVIQAKCGC